MDNYQYDMLLTHALAQYLHDGHPYTWDIRSHVALKELRPGQERHMIQINDVSAVGVQNSRGPSVLMMETAENRAAAHAGT